MTGGAAASRRVSATTPLSLRSVHCSLLERLRPPAQKERCPRRRPLAVDIQGAGKPLDPPHEVSSLGKPSQILEVPRSCPHRQLLDEQNDLRPQCLLLGKEF